MKPLRVTACALASLCLATATPPPDAPPPAPADAPGPHPAAAEPRGAPSATRPDRPEPPRAWLGIDLDKPDNTITAQIPSLPPGVGFLVRAVHPQGPAADAGLRDFDVLWKLGDQMLVNEGQLAALLRLRQPGDEITLTGFRGGKDLEVKLTLGEAPARVTGPLPELLDETIFPHQGCHGPMRVINLADKVATYSNEDGSAELRKQGDHYQLRILAADETVLFDGEIAAEGGVAAVPAGWQRRVMALRRGLDHQLAAHSRQPRPRVVPPPREDLR